MIKYKTSDSDCGKIVEVEVISETPKFVTVRYENNHRWLNEGPTFYERREAKISSYDRYHDTWEEAYAYLLKRAEERAMLARRRLEEANAYLGNIKGMKKP